MPVAHLVEAPTVLYRFYDAEGTLLYLGITSTLMSRLGAHSGDKAWFRGVASATIEHFPDRASALTAERDAVQAEHPRYNVVHQPKPKPPSLGGRLPMSRAGIVTEVSFTEVCTRLGQYAERAAHGEVIFVTKRGRPYVRVAPYANGDGVRCSLGEAHDRFKTLTDRAAHGKTVIVTKHGRPYVQLTAVPKEPAMTSYIAAIATTSDVVAGDLCDVSVIECEEVSVGIDDNGDEILEQQMTNRVAMPSQETTVRTDDADSAAEVEDEAEQILAANGWRVTGKWEPSDNASYATVEPA